MNTDKKVWDWRTHIIHSAPQIAPYRHILLTLSCYMNSAGSSCFPSVATLCEKTCLGKTTVIKYLKQAEDDGWIVRSRVGLAGQGWNRNEYKAMIPDDVIGKKEVHEANRVSKGGSSGDKGGSPDDKKAVHEVNTISSKKNSLKNPSNNSANGENLELLKQQKQKTRKEPPNSASPPTLFPPEPEPTFDEFWEKYQKKVDTAKCKTKWRRLKSEEKQAIMDHLDEYIPATPDKQYRKSPLTYLNNRTWEDEELPTFGGRNGRLPVHDTTKNAAGRHERTGFDQ